MSVYRSVVDLEQRNQPGALCTVVRSRGSTPRQATSKMLVYQDGSITGTVGGGEMENRVIKEALQAIQDGKSRLLSYSMTDPSRGDPGVCGGQVEVFVEPIQPRPVLVVVGAGHVGRAVAHLAHWLGFYVVVNDDRADFCTPEATPDADEYLPVPMSELPQHLELTPWTYLVLTTRGSNVDAQGMPALLEGNAAYIGVIGSRRRWEHTRQGLLKAGVPAEKLDQVRSPIGLELQAETPEEIAVSIMAEILMLQRQADAKPMGVNHPTKRTG
jgi:xanthine dehydrogenase accessory factor